MFDLVERDADVGALAVDDGELGADGFPGESQNILLDFHAVNRNLLLLHVEHLEVVKQALGKTNQRTDDTNQ